MFSKTNVAFVALSVLAASEQVFCRMKYLERDGLVVRLDPRRFGQEQPAILNDLRAACAGQVCGTLAGGAISTLLAASPECAQQDFADRIIDESRQFDAATQANMIRIAQVFRQAEKNTPPDFTTNPPTLRNSVFCQKAPKNQELAGLVQAQDPANDPNIFFDPALKASVTKGSQANTAPFQGGAGAGGAQAGQQGNQNNQQNNGNQNNQQNNGNQNNQQNNGNQNNQQNNGNQNNQQCAPPQNNGGNQNNQNNNAGAGSGNLQKFTGTLNNVSAPAVTAVGGKFQVDGNATFNNLQSALVRSCDVQNNQCANKFNSQQGNSDVGACNGQQQQCLAQARAGGN